MKHWGLRILSALLTFALGTGTVIVGERYLKPIPIQPAHVASHLNFQIPPLPSPKIAEDTQPEKKTDEIMKPHSVSISPYKIKRLIDENKQGGEDQPELNLEPIWDDLNIWTSGKYGFEMDHCTGNCNATIYSLELDSKQGKEILLRLYVDSTWEYRYLIFKPVLNQSGSGKKWMFLGYFDMWAWWSDEPQHRVIAIGDKRWLVLRHITGHGSAYGRDDDTWYEVSDKGVKMVLNYQIGLFEGMDPSLDSNTRILKTKYNQGVITLVIQIKDSYENYMSENNIIPLWMEKYRVTFVKSPGSSKFLPDLARSELSAEALCDLTNPDESCSTEEDVKNPILQYHYQELANISIKGNRKQKEWLRDFLDTCDESPEKQSLQKALEGARP